VNVSAINSSAEGFLFTGADGTILTDLSASDNAVGLSIVGSVGVVVDGGDFDRNDRTGVRVGSAPGTTIGGAVVSDNVRDGIEVDGSDGVTIRDTIARDNGRWAVIASNGAGAYTAENLTLRSAVLDARARDVALAGVESPPADPADRRNVGVYVNATNTATGGYLDLNASYDPTVVDGVDVNESTLGLWEHDGSTWEPVDSSVDTDANTVSANLTEFSTFAPLGVVETVSEPEPTPTPTSTPTPTPVVGDRGSGSGGPNVPPVAAFIVPTTDPETGTAVGFDASGSDDSTGIVVSYEWDFDGDGTTDATSSSPGVSHTYDVAGTYEVSLTVVDSFGATNTTIRTVEVSQASGSGSGVGSGGVEATPTATTPTPTPTTETPASPPEADADADGETATATAAVTPVPPAALFGVQFPWWLLLVLLAAVVAVLVYRRRA
jgi:PKD repeat protein